MDFTINIRIMLQFKIKKLHMLFEHHWEYLQMVGPVRSDTISIFIGILKWMLDQVPYWLAK